MLSLVNNIHEKTSKRVKTDVTFNSADMLFVICTRVITLQSCYNFALVLQLCTLVTILHSCYNFALVLHEKALVFSQSDMHKFVIA